MWTEAEITSFTWSGPEGIDGVFFYTCKWQCIKLFVYLWLHIKGIIMFLYTFEAQLEIIVDCRSPPRWKGMTGRKMALRSMVSGQVIGVSFHLFLPITSQSFPFPFINCSFVACVNCHLRPKAAVLKKNHTTFTFRMLAYDLFLCFTDCNQTILLTGSTSACELLHFCLKGQIQTTASVHTLQLFFT